MKIGQIECLNGLSKGFIIFVNIIEFEHVEIIYSATLKSH